MSAVLAIAKLVIKEIFRKKDFYVALLLIGVILFYAQSLRFYNAQNVSRYMAEIGLALIFFFSVVLSAALAGRQFPSEVQNRTITPLLSKPVSRAHFVIGKFAGSFAAGVSAFALFYAAFLAVLTSKAGTLSWPVAGQTFYLFALNLMVFCAMVSAFSYLLTVSANVTVSLTVYFLVSLYGAHLKETAESFSMPLRAVCEAIYYAFPHFEFFDLRQRFIHGWGTVPAPLVGFLTLYAACYTAFFLLAAYVSFRRRPL